MKYFLWNIWLSLAWGMALGQLTVANLLSGFVLGHLILRLIRRGLGPTDYFSKFSQIAKFVLFYLKQLIFANLRVAYDVITPTHYMKPAVVGIPLDVRTDAEITLLANLITLTPGSVSLDLTPDRQVLFVHLMYVDRNDIEAAKRQIKHELERRVLELLR